MESLRSLWYNNTVFRNIEYILVLRGGFSRGSFYNLTRMSESRPSGPRRSGRKTKGWHSTRYGFEESDEEELELSLAKLNTRAEELKLLIAEETASMEAPHAAGIARGLSERHGRTSTAEPSPVPVPVPRRPTPAPRSRKTSATCSSPGGVVRRLDSRMSISAAEQTSFDQPALHGVVAPGTAGVPLQRVSYAPLAPSPAPRTRVEPRLARVSTSRSSSAGMLGSNDRESVTQDHGQGPSVRQQNDMSQKQESIASHACSMACNQTCERSPPQPQPQHQVLPGQNSAFNSIATQPQSTPLDADAAGASTVGVHPSVPAAAAGGRVRSVPAATAAASASGVRSMHHIKPLQLPKFNGQPSEYLRWRQRFKSLIEEDPLVTEYYKLARLRESVEGCTADELIRDIIDGPGAFKAAMKEIEAWYGDEEQEIERQMKELRSWPAVTNERDTAGMKRFALKLRSILVNMTISSHSPHRELYCLATQKVPRNTLILFLETHDDGGSSVTEFSEWLMKRVHTMHRVDERMMSVSVGGMAPAGGSTSSKPWGKPPHAQSHQHNFRTERTLATESTTKQTSKPPPSWSQRCRKCAGPHTLNQCNEFRDLRQHDRFKLVRLLKLCVCCLKAGHWAAECDQSGCKTCKGKHHTLLHGERTHQEDDHSSTATGCQAVEVTHVGMNLTPNVAAPVNDEQPTCSTPSVVARSEQRNGIPVTMTSSTQSGDVGLTSFMTTPVEVVSHSRTARANVLLDSGSSCSYVSERLVKRLNLRGTKRKVTVGVIGGKVLEEDLQVVNLGIRHAGSDETTNLDVYVLPKVTSDIQVVNWNEIKQRWSHLADIEFLTASHGTLDLLVGLNAPALHCANEERHGGDSAPIARKTPIGWVCFGPVVQQEMSTHASFHATAISTSNLDSIVKQFWELDAVGMQATTGDYLTPEEQRAEESTRQRLIYANGRFMVGIPWRGGVREPNVVSNRQMAEHRLQSLLRSLDRRPGMRLRYSKVLQDYLDKAYIRKLTSEEVDRCGTGQWYLPHFAVIREDKATTKVRVVFDAAAKFNNVAINDLMLPGPKLQNNLVKILLQFCVEPVVLIADISEMFLQVSLADSDRKYHRFVWESDDRVDVYEFTRLAFGMRASPYLACRAVLETADRFGDAFDPEVSEIVRNAFYVDDMLRSMSDPNRACRIRAQLQELLQKGGFQLRKWLSNSQAVMDSIPPDLRASATVKPILEHGAADTPAMPKTLGVTWDVEGDCFLFQYQGVVPTRFTKRTVLSHMASVFDPRGQLTPFTIRAKLMFQELCMAGIGWDDELPAKYLQAWKTWFA